MLLTAAGTGCTRGERATGADPAIPGTGAQTVTTLAPTTTVAPTTTARPVPALPRGGHQIFPRFRVVGFYGMPGLDALGAGPPDLVAQRLARQAAAYAQPQHPVLPMFELIATIARRTPGPDGMYRSRQDDGVVRRYLDAARRHKALLVLDIQPGRADFLSEVRYWERFLREPDVGVALDPEFSMRPGQVPGRQLGQTDAAAINRACARVSAIVRQERLPQKLLMIHQFEPSMITDRPKVRLQRGLAMVWNADGFGTRTAKLKDYAAYAKDERFRLGLKLFYREDDDLMRPSEVLRLKPVPNVINYQ